MLDLSAPDFWVVAALGFIVGAFIAWLATSLMQRRANKGASVVQLRKEMEDYREEVNEHFARTAELFKETTEKYRDLYEHLAGGAQELCDDLPDRARVEFRPGHLLAANTQADRDVREPEPAAANGSDADEQAASQVRAAMAEAAEAKAEPATPPSGPPRV